MRRMGTYAAELATLRSRARGDDDVVRAPAGPAAIRALREAVRRQLGLLLPGCYEAFLAECNGFSLASRRVLGVDADLTGDPAATAPRGPDACLGYNLEREAARLRGHRPQRSLFLAVNGDVAWVMKEEGSFWEIDPDTLEEIERYHDGVTMLRSVARRVHALL